MPPSSPLELERTWTADELLGLPDDGRRYEVVDGQLVVSPRQTITHERIAMRLAVQLGQQVPPGVEAVHELGLGLGTDVRFPDAGLVRTPGRSPASQVGNDPVAVLLAVEVVSRSSRKTDRMFKPAGYAAAGVPASWRVETEPEPEVAVPLALVVDVPALLAGLTQ